MIQMIFMCHRAETILQISKGTFCVYLNSLNLCIICVGIIVVPCGYSSKDNYMQSLKLQTFKRSNIRSIY